MAAVKARILDITRGHGLFCLAFGCRYPYWHGRNYRGRPE